jgi:O-antigen ligase
MGQTFTFSRSPAAGRFARPVQVTAARVPRAPAPSGRPGAAALPAAAQRTFDLRFGLFLLLTGVIFVRPSEILQPLSVVPIYQCIIILCILTSLKPLGRLLRWSSLRQRPETICVIGLLFTVVLSHLRHRNIWGARMNGLDFAKVLTYYLLLLTIITTAARLRLFLKACVVFIFLIASLALLQYHGLINLPALAAMAEHEGVNALTGQANITIRLMATGIFNDPNDFSLILNFATMAALYFMIQRKGIGRLGWAGVIGVLLYAFALTRSRGGFLALAAASLVLLVSWLGWKRGSLIALIVLPAMLIAFGGRQTNIDVGDANDTAQGRIHLWRDSFALMHQAPFLGIGVGQLAEENGFVAHNSYVHAYAEMGLLGGMLFLNALCLPLAALRKYSRKVPAGQGNLDVPQLRRLTPFILAMTFGYAAGLFSLSRCYELSTFLMLGVAGAFISLASQGAPSVHPIFSAALVKRMMLVGLGGIVGLELFVRLFVR